MHKSARNSDSDLNYKTGKCKSGILSKVSDRVRVGQSYPQSHSRFKYVNDKVSFDKLDMNLFVAGELEIISSVYKVERKARVELLKWRMYLSSFYDFSVVKNLYAAELIEIELGLKKWGDDFQYVETVVLSSCTSRSHIRHDRAERMLRTKSDRLDGDGDRIWFCKAYQKNKYQAKSPHKLVVRGVMRLAHHMFATCLLKDSILTALVRVRTVQNDIRRSLAGCMGLLWPIRLWVSDCCTTYFKVVKSVYRVFISSCMCSHSKKCSVCAVSSMSKNTVINRVSVHEQVRSSGKHNFEGCRIPVNHHVDTEFMKRMLGSDYSDLVVCDLLKYGFPIRYKDPGFVF